MNKHILKKYRVAECMWPDRILKEKFNSVTFLFAKYTDFRTLAVMSNPLKVCLKIHRVLSEGSPVRKSELTYSVRDVVKCPESGS